MATDQFYRDMSDYQLKAVLKEIMGNVKAEPEDKGMQEELELCLNVMTERGISLSSSITDSLQSLRGYVEFGMGNLLRWEEPPEYKVGHGGKREGAGRPPVGETRKVSISLPEKYWETFDESKGERTQSQFLREIIMKELDDKL